MRDFIVNGFFLCLVLAPIFALAAFLWQLWMCGRDIDEEDSE